MSALFALAAAIGWGSSDFAAGYASRRSSAVSVVILTHFASVIALAFVVVDLGPIWMMFGDIVRSVGPGDNGGSIRWGGPGIDGSPSAADISWGLAAGMGGGFGAMLLFRGLGKGSMAVVAPITAAGAATIPVLFGILTGDAITIFGIAGIALALIAIVLVSLSGSDDNTGDSTGDDAGANTADDDVEEWLTVPDDWSTEFRLPAPVGPAVSTGPVGVTQMSMAPSGSPAFAPPPPPPPPPQSPPLPRQPGPQPSQAGRPGPPTPAPAIEVAPTAHRMGIIHDGELRMPLRTVRQAVVALVATAVLSAAAIASRPIRALLDGQEMTGPITANLVFALVIVGLAAFALNSVKPLFDFSNLSLLQPFDTNADSEHRDVGRNPAVSWRAIVRQPGVTEALLSGIGFGLFFVFIYRANEVAGHWPLLSARAVSVVMFGLVALATTTAMLPERGSRRPVLLAGVLDAAAAVFFVMSTRIGLLSVGAVLAALYPVATVVLARVITKERIRRQQMVGLALALVAVGLLAA